MEWFNRFSRSDAVRAAAASRVTVEPGVPHEGRRNRVVPYSGIPSAPEPPLSEEIKRRQVALLLRYVTAMRTRY